VRSTKEANNPETARKLWEVSEERMTGLATRRLKHLHGRSLIP
jgi:hypothetical protein